jgi:peptidoglycan hydrolase CwlO-like protein
MVSDVRTPHAGSPVPTLKGSLYRQMAASRRRTWLVWSSCVLGLIALIAVAALAAPLRAGAAGSTDPDVASRLQKIKATLKDSKADLGKLQKALDNANGALNQAESELAAADLQVLSARAERNQARTAISRSARQLQQLRKVVGDEARGMYMSGSPSGLAALVEQDDAKDLLDQIATLDQLARANNDTITNMVIRQKEYVTAQAALVKAERDINRSQAEIRKKIRQATELRDVRAQAKEALDAKIADLLGEEAVLRNTQQQTAANQSGQRRTGTKCNLSGTSDAEYWIIMRESGGDPTAANPSSTAFGLGQLLLDLRQRLLGADYDTIDCGKQLYAFRAYVKERYGTAENAKAFWIAHGWY